MEKVTFDKLLQLISEFEKPFDSFLTPKRLEEETYEDYKKRMKLRKIYIDAITKQ